jgi:hypothetical protein
MELLVSSSPSKQLSVSQESGGYIFRRRNHGLFQASYIYFHRCNNIFNPLKIIYSAHTNLTKADWNNMTWEEATSTPLNAYNSFNA